MELLKSIGIEQNIEFISPKRDNYKNLENYFLNSKPCILIYENMKNIDSTKFKQEFMGLNLSYATTGNSDITEGVLDINNVDNNKYIFHDFNDDENINTKVLKYIDLPNDLLHKHDKKVRIQRLYYGKAKTGSHLHKHSPALNYLIAGKKLWLLIPPSLPNISFIIKNNFDYGNIKCSTLEWFNSYFNLIKECIPDYFIFIQHENEVVYIPCFWHHMIINLDEAIGITFSWIRPDCINNT